MKSKIFCDCGQHPHDTRVNFLVLQLVRHLLLSGPSDDLMMPLEIVEKQLEDKEGH
jgi:hypothetical protein